MSWQIIGDDGARSNRTSNRNSRNNSPRCLSPSQHLSPGVDNASLSLSVSEVNQSGEANGPNRQLSGLSQKSSRSNSWNASSQNSPRGKSKPTINATSSTNLLPPQVSPSAKRESSRDLCDLLNEAVSVVTSERRLSSERRQSGEGRLSRRQSGERQRSSNCISKVPHITPPDPSGSASDDGGDMSSASSTSTLSYDSKTPRNNPEDPDSFEISESRQNQVLLASAQAFGGKVKNGDEDGANRRSTVDVVDHRPSLLSSPALKHPLLRPRSASAPAESDREDTDSDRESQSSASDVFSDAFGGIIDEETCLEADPDVGEDADDRSENRCDEDKRPLNNVPPIQPSTFIDTLRSKPPEYDMRRKGGRSREEMKHLYKLLQMSDFFQSVGRPLCECACSMMELAEVSAGTTIYEEGSTIESLFILLDGIFEKSISSDTTFTSDATCSSLGGLLFSGSIPRLQVLSSEEALASDETIIASTSLTLASIPCKCFLEIWRKTEQRRSDFTTAVKVIRETETAKRTAAEIESIFNYLQWHEAFSSVPNAALENVARELAVEEFSAGEVMAVEGSRPESMLIVLSGQVASWRAVPCMTAKKSRRLKHFELNSSSEHCTQIEKAIKQASRTEEENRRTEEEEEDIDEELLHEDSKEKKKRHACIDVTKEDRLIRPLEWALANGSLCTFSLVACSNVAVLALPRSAYLQFVRPFRSEVSRNESALFVVQKVPMSCRTAHDEPWLLETALSQKQFFRALPMDLRSRILCRSRHKRLRKGDESDHASTTSARLSGGYAGRRAYAGIGMSKQCQTLGVGSVLGEFGLAVGAEEKQWATGVCAEEDCSLLELTRDKVQGISIGYMQQISKSITSSLPLQTLERVIHVCRTTPVEKRSIDHLEILSLFVKKYKQFSHFESHVCLELCQWLYFREFEAGELVETSAYFCIVLKGELVLSLMHEDAELRILTVPLWGAMGELEQKNLGTQDEDPSARSACTLKASTSSWLMCIDIERVARIVSRSQKGMADRDRAISTLRHTPPLYRVAADIEMLERLVSGSPFFAGFEKHVVQEVCRSMTWAGFDTLMPIVRQGDDADRCFVLLKGSVGVWIGYDKPAFERRRSLREKPDVLKKAAHVLIDAGKSQKEKGEEKAIELASGFMRKRNLRKKGRRLKALVKVFGSKLSAAENANAFLTELPTQAEYSEEMNTQTKPQVNTMISIDPQTGGPKGGQLVKVLGEGAIFGDTGLLRSEKRNATIVAREHCDCGVIHKSVFNRILKAARLKQLQQQAEFLERHLPKPQPKSAAKPGKRGSGELQNEADKAAPKVAPPVLSSEDYEHLASFFSKHTETRGKVVCSVGKPCARLLVIKEGYCKVFHHGGPQGPQEIGTLGFGHILGAASYILGHGVEPYRVVCASHQVEFLRMEATDVKTRIPVPLLEAIGTVERDRQARLEQRVSLLDSRKELKQCSLVPRRLFKDRWLSGPFILQKDYALMNDLGKCSLMRRMFSEWEPPGPEEDTSTRKSILHYHLDDFVTDEDILRHDHVEEIPKVKQLLALPWHQEGNLSEDSPRHGRGHRQMLVKRHLAEQESVANAAATRAAIFDEAARRKLLTKNRMIHDATPEKQNREFGKPRPQSAPGMDVSPWGVPLGKVPMGAKRNRFIDFVHRPVGSTSPVHRTYAEQEHSDSFALASVGSGDMDISAASLIADMHSVQSPNFSPCPSRRQSTVGHGKLLPTPTAGFNFRSQKSPSDSEEDLGDRLLPLPSSKPLTPIQSPRRALVWTTPFEEVQKRKSSRRPMSAHAAQAVREGSPLGDISVKTKRPMSAEARGIFFFFDDEPSHASRSQVVSPFNDVLISKPIRPLSAEERPQRRYSRPKGLPRRHTAPVKQLTLFDVDNDTSPRLRTEDSDIATPTHIDTVPFSLDLVSTPRSIRNLVEEEKLQEDDEESLQEEQLDLVEGNEFEKHAAPNDEDIAEESSDDLQPTPVHRLSGSSDDMQLPLAPHLITSPPIAPTTPEEPAAICGVVPPRPSTLDDALVPLAERQSPCQPMSQALAIPQPPKERYDDGQRRLRRLPGALNAGRVVPHGIDRQSVGKQCGPTRCRASLQAEATRALREAQQSQIEASSEMWQASKSTLCSVQCFARGDAFRQMQRNVDRTGTSTNIAKTCETRNRRGPAVAAARAEVEAARRKAGR